MQRLIISFLLFFFLGFGTTPQAVRAAESAGQGSAAATGIAVRLAAGAQSAAGAANSNVTGGKPEGAQPGANATVEPVDLSEQIDLSKMRQFLETLDQDIQKSLPSLSLSRIFEGLKTGTLNLDPGQVGREILAYIGKEILRTAPLIGQLLVLAVLSALLQQLQGAFDGSVGKLSRMLSYLVLLSLAMASFQAAMDVARGAVDQMTGLMQALFPVMLTLLLAMGNLATAALFRPMVLASLTFLATLFKTIVLPLFFLGAVLRLFNQISEQFKLTKLAALLEFAGKVSLGFVMTLFVALMTLQGVTGGIADGVTLRTAKYSVDLIPVVGKFFKDSVELVLTSGLLLRNALGLIAFLALLIISLGPLVKILAMLFVFKISAALIEPLGEKNLADSLQDMAKSLTYIFGAVASVAMMFFIAVVVVVSTGNLSVMLR